MSPLCTLLFALLFVSVGCQDPWEKVDSPEAKCAELRKSAHEIDYHPTYTMEEREYWGSRLFDKFESDTGIPVSDCYDPNPRTTWTPTPDPSTKKQVDQMRECSSPALLRKVIDVSRHGENTQVVSVVKADGSTGEQIWQIEDFLQDPRDPFAPYSNPVLTRIEDPEKYDHSGEYLWCNAKALIRTESVVSGRVFPEFHWREISYQVHLTDGRQTFRFQLNSRIP